MCQNVKFKIVLTILTLLIYSSEGFATETVKTSFPITLQWIDGNPGKVVFIKTGKDEFKITGIQRSKEDLLEIDGTVKMQGLTKFLFTGKILTRISYIAGGRECIREGSFTFRKMGKRKYFRLKEMENPCDGVVDYVDIFK